MYLFSAQWHITIGGFEGVLVGGMGVLVAGTVEWVGGIGVFVAGEDDVLVTVSGKVLISEGRTVLVLVKMRVAVEFDGCVGMIVRVWFGPIVIVGISARLAVAPGRFVAAPTLVEFNPKPDCRVANASPPLIGVICCDEQNCPVMVQATASSSAESG